MSIAGDERAALAAALRAAGPGAPTLCEGWTTRDLAAHLWLREHDPRVVLGLVLPDLRSRMDAMPQVRLMPPDESLLAAVLVKLFADRQQSVPADLIDWLVLHMPRDLGLARQLVAAMDRAAMADKRPITRRIAAELLNGLSEGET